MSDVKAKMHQIRFPADPAGGAYNVFPLAVFKGSGGSRICQRGAAHGERAECEPKWGSEVGAPSGVQGQDPWWAVMGVKLKTFCTFLYIIVAKS